MPQGGHTEEVVGFSLGKCVALISPRLPKKKRVWFHKPTLLDLMGGIEEHKNVLLARRTGVSPVRLR